MESSGEVAEARPPMPFQPTSKRVRMIFSIMASPNRIDILRILNAKGPVTYSELKGYAGFRSKQESGKFAYHLRKLLRQSLVSLNKSERRYTITNLGKLVLNLTRQIEERSVIESGKMYVRSSNDLIEEFHSSRILQSLVREGTLPMELAQKITEETESKIYKYQPTYLTGPLIREIVNSVLIEHGHEEYRNKLVRLGMPASDIREAISNVDGVDNGAGGILLRAGQKMFSENLMINVLPKDIADSHLSGDLHITNPGVWSMLPDTVFINAKDLLDDGAYLGGKHLGVSRVAPTRSLDGLASSLSLVISLISTEASQEVVLDGLPQAFSRHAKDLPDLEAKLTGAFVAASAAPRHNGNATVVSVRLQLGTENKANGAILGAYRNYARITPRPRIGLVVDYERGRVSDVSARIAEIVSLGGVVALGRGQVSAAGITNPPRAAAPLSIKLQSVSINLPRLAFESNKDSTYFRARLAILMKPVLSFMAARKKEVSDLTRRGLNPILARHSQYMQRSSVSLVVNLVGLREAVFDVLGCPDDRSGRDVLYRVVETAVDVAAKKGKETGDEIRVCMVDSDGAARFSALDDEKYGKNSVPGGGRSDAPYGQGVALDASAIGALTPRSDEISHCNKLAGELNGGLAVKLEIAREAPAGEIKGAIEKAAALLQSFVPVKKVPICGGCGFKDAKLEDKCPACKSPYIIV